MRAMSFNPVENRGTRSKSGSRGELNTERYDTWNIDPVDDVE
jgi:hypothetical protein